MNGEPLPDADHIVRHCKKSHINTETNMPSASGFMRRRNRKEESCSVMWLESFPSVDQDSQRAEAQARLASKGFSYKEGQGFALLNVGTTTTQVSEAGYQISILHEPTTNLEGEVDDSHSGIHGLPFDDELAGPSEFVALSVISFHPIEV